MRAIAVPSPQPEPQHDLDPGFQMSDARPHHDHEAFAARVADVDRLVDKKARFVMEAARLRALVDSHPEQSERCLCLIEVLEENVDHLQEQIDRELKGLLYSMGKAPAPSRFLDDLPG